MTRKTLGIIGGVVVLGVGGWMFTRSPQTSASHSQTAIGVKTSNRSPRTQSVPANGKNGKSTAHSQQPQRSVPQPRGLAASFPATVHQSLPSGATPVPVPWQPQASWAFVPQAMHGQLWWGSRQGSGSWHWVSEDLPGALSHQLPTPVYDALQWAYDLHANEPGPPLPGTMSWRAIAGRVGEPVAWTTQTLPADQSPIGGQTLELTVWVPSETGVFQGVYGLETLWNAQNAHTGHGALLMLVAAKHVPQSGSSPITR